MQEKPIRASLIVAGCRALFFFLFGGYPARAFGRSKSAFAPDKISTNALISEVLKGVLVGNVSSQSKCQSVVIEIFDLFLTEFNISNDRMGIIRSDCGTGIDIRGDTGKQ